MDSQGQILGWGMVITFSENRERLNPLVNHVYLILSAFQWPLGDESWLIHVNPSFSNTPHV